MNRDIILQHRIKALKQYYNTRKNFLRQNWQKKRCQHISASCLLWNCIRFWGLHLWNWKIYVFRPGQNIQRRTRQQSSLIWVRLKYMRVMYLISNDLVCTQTLLSLNCVCVLFWINYHLHLHPDTTQWTLNVIFIAC